uniref:Uncharacterized protein n=1 Tax=Tanacetum cinerariifolium TaxID=118510 RepID=A0A6L2JWM2_TANCI|nr:hypothetical protein [Tanacetum cinerariifolium]
MHFGEPVVVGYFWRAELTFKAEELLLLLAGAEDGLFIMTPFKVLALNVDFDLKIDLIVFGLETVAEELVTATGGSVVFLCDSAGSILPVSLFCKIKPSTSDSHGLSTPGMDTFVSSAEDFINTRLLWALEQRDTGIGHKNKQNLGFASQLRCNYPAAISETFHKFFHHVKSKYEANDLTNDGSCKHPTTCFQVWWRVQKRPIRYVSKEARHGQGIVGTRSIVINNVVNGRGPSMELVTAKEWEVRAFATIIAKPYESGYWTWKMHHEFDISK